MDRMRVSHPGRGGLSAKDFERATGAGSSRHPRVIGEQRSVEQFGDGYIAGVIGRVVAAQFPHTGKKGRVSNSLDGQVGVLTRGGYKRRTGSADSCSSPITAAADHPWLERRAVPAPLADRRAGL